MEVLKLIFQEINRNISSSELNTFGLAVEEEVHIGAVSVNKSAGIGRDSVSVNVLSVGGYDIHLGSVGNLLRIDRNVAGLGPNTCRGLVAGVGVGSGAKGGLGGVFYGNSVFVKEKVLRSLKLRNAGNA